MTSWNGRDHLSRRVSRTGRKFVTTSWNNRRYLSKVSEQQEYLSKVSRTKRNTCHAQLEQKEKLVMIGQNNGELLSMVARTIRKILHDWLEQQEKLFMITCIQGTLFSSENGKEAFKRLTLTIGNTNRDLISNEHLLATG